MSNVLLILLDSVNRHHLRPYQSDAVADVPNFERFRARAHRFDNHFVGSLPCMPARREIYAGRKEMAWRPWGPLEPFDERLPRLLANAGYSTGLITDHYHYWEKEANGYIQSFDSVEMIRGHENDFYRPAVPDGAELPEWVERIEAYRPGKGRSYYANVKDFGGEEDFFPAKVMTQASSWLHRHAGERPFFLQVESFDVHEPFHVPEPYASMYLDGSAADAYAAHNVWPPYQDTEQLARYMEAASPEELAFVRSQYHGKLTMVDRWLGRLFDTLDEMDLWKDTTVILTTDHGHDLGERGTFGKQWPHFDSHANIPLFLHNPEHPAADSVVRSLTTTVDLFATVLDAAGLPVPTEPGHARSLLPLLDGGGEPREALLYGTFGQGVVVTDGTWTLMKGPEEWGPLYSYSPSLFWSLTVDHVQEPVDSGHFIDGVRLPQWRIPVQVTPLSLENHLYHRNRDPHMTINLWEEEPEQRERLLDVLRRLLATEGAPAEQFERLGLTRR